MIMTLSNHKGRKYLLVLATLGLALPLGTAIYAGIISIEEYLQDSKILNFWDAWLMISIISFVIFFAGLGIARAILGGKIWAHNFWSVSGVMIGFFLLIGGLFHWVVGAIGIYILIIGGVSAVQKDVKGYLNSVRRDEITELIDKIGERGAEAASE